MNSATLLGWVGGVLSTAIVLLLKALIEKRKEERRARRAIENQDRDKRSESDRLTYRQRVTVLIRVHLATYIRSGRWWSDEQDLRGLLGSLGNGTYEHFVDESVDAPYMKLVECSIELAKKRLDDRIDEQDIQRYNEIRQQWERAAKLSFGPLPETPDLAQPRYGRGPGDESSQRAA